MKRRSSVLLIIVVLITGIIIGSQNSVGTSNYFEEAKNEFEQNITIPNNNYNPKTPKVEGNLVSKIAVKIDKKISDLLNAILSKL